MAAKREWLMISDLAKRFDVNINYLKILLKEEGLIDNNGKITNRTMDLYLARRKQRTTAKTYIWDLDKLKKILKYKVKEVLPPTKTAAEIEDDRLKSKQNKKRFELFIQYQHQEMEKLTIAELLRELQYWDWIGSLTLIGYQRRCNAMTQADTDKWFTAKSVVKVIKSLMHNAEIREKNIANKWIVGNFGIVERRVGDFLKPYLAINKSQNQYATDRLEDALLWLEDKEIPSKRFKLPEFKELLISDKNPTID